jgi:hypothetical protein
LILDSAAHILHQEARWAGGMQGPQWSSYLADRVIASTGLAAWMQAGKHAFGLPIQAELASRARESFGELPQGLRRVWAATGSWTKSLSRYLRQPASALATPRVPS